MEKFKFPVSVPIYLGSGDEGLQRKERLLQKKGDRSLSEFVVELLQKADPTIFKSVRENGKRSRSN